MGNSSSGEIRRCGGYYECEVLGRGHEAAESGARWKNCEKNSGHKHFFPIHNYVDKHLPYTLNPKQRDWFQAHIDLTVRIRIQWTSFDRSDNDDLGDYRGTDRLRLGTGFIFDIGEPESNKPCPCRFCDSKVVQKYWVFHVKTAHHVVFNTEEAKETRVDMFYDEEGCDLDGRMKSAWAVEAVEFYANKDVCDVLCVTHDEVLAERITSLNQRWRSVQHFDMNTLSSPKKHYLFARFQELFSVGVHDLVLIVSHPHGQPKKITLGTWRCHGNARNDGEYYVEYNTATCPGSSGAPITKVMAQACADHRDSVVFPSMGSEGAVHTATYYTKSTLLAGNLNYGSGWFYSSE